MNTTTYHESAPELVDDGPDEEQAARDEWAENQLPTLPHILECDNCSKPVTSIQGPFVPGLEDGVPMVKGRHFEVFVCRGCVDDMGEQGYRPW